MLSSCIIVLVSLRILSTRYTHNERIAQLLCEAEEKGKKISAASSLSSTSGISISTRHLSPSASLRDVPVSPVSSLGASEVDPRISDGSRGNSVVRSPTVGGASYPPPYIPDLEVGRTRDGTRELMRTYGKDFEFPGIASG